MNETKPGFSRFVLLAVLLLISTIQAAHARSGLWDTGEGPQIDVTTGLMWQLPSPRISRDWESARSYCLSLSLLGKSDWRLPSIKELMSVRGTFAAIYASPGWWSSTQAPTNSEAHRTLGFGGVPSGRLNSQIAQTACVRDTERVR